MCSSSTPTGHQSQPLPEHPARNGATENHLDNADTEVRHSVLHSHTESQITDRAPQLTTNRWIEA